MDWFVHLPAVASEHASRIDHTTFYIHVLMLALFVVWISLFLFMLVRFRAGRHPKADYRGLKTHLSTWGEGAVAVAEAILLIGFSIPLYSERVDDVPPAADSTVVRVIGEQFAWNIHYPGPDGVFGRTNPTLIDVETNPIGLDDEDPAAADDITTINQLHVPVDRPVLIELTSKDVIHSFWLPEMRVKQDAVPGLVFPVWFQPTKTTEAMRQETGEEAFQFEIACAQLCGLGHYRMRGFLTVDTRADFDRWMAEQEQLRQEAGEGDDFWG